MLYATIATLVAVSLTTIRAAERNILACSSCDRTVAIPFSYVLDRITGRDGTVTDYPMSQPAKCPRCHADVLEDTLVERKP